MTNQHTPVLVLAQSGRFLAQAAKQAGYPVWVADCFGDTDTLAYACRWLAIPAINELSEHTLLTTLGQLTKGQTCQLVCGSGVEKFHSILTRLPEHIKLVGNDPTTIANIKNPTLFFETLKLLKINHHKSQLKRPSDTTNWLMKANFGFGGSHIQAANTEKHRPEYYYQQYEIGQNISALFLANGTKAKLISLNEQHLSGHATTPFLLKGLSAPGPLSDQNTLIVKTIIDRLSLAFGLVGFNSIDLIVNRKDQIFLLEVNPRPSASMELLAKHEKLFQLHIDACHGQLSDNISLGNNVGSLLYHFASADIVIPANMNWPKSCHDLPADGTEIKQSCPIFTSVLNRNEDTTETHRSIAALVNKQFIKS